MVRIPDKNIELAKLIARRYGCDLTTYAASDVIQPLLNNWIEAAEKQDDLAKFALSDLPDFLGHLELLTARVLKALNGGYANESEATDDYPDLADFGLRFTGKVERA